MTRPSPLVACTVGAAVLLPLTQDLLWTAGFLLNNDVLNQFSIEGSNRDIWGGLVFHVFFGSGAQIIIGLLLGSVTGWAASYACPARRVLLLLLSVLGSVFLVWCLWRNWSFKGNHCTPSDGCDATSPLSFDFPAIVFFACPLSWCVGTFLYAVIMREKQARNFGEVAGLFFVVFLD